MEVCEVMHANRYTCTHLLQTCVIHVTLDGHCGGVYAHVHCVYTVHLCDEEKTKSRQFIIKYPDARLAYTCKLAKYKNKDDPGHFHLMKADD